MGNPVLQIRLSDERRERYVTAANREGLSLVDWVRSVCDNASAGGYGVIGESIASGSVGKKGGSREAKVKKNVPGAVKSTEEAEKKLGEIRGKKESSPVEKSSDARRIGRNGKVYTGASVVKFGRKAFEILVEREGVERAEWTFDAPEFG